MIKKYIIYSFLLFVFSCSNIEYVLKDSGQINPLKDKTALLIGKNTEEKFIRGLYSYIGNNEKYINFNCEIVLLILKLTSAILLSPRLIG